MIREINTKSYVSFLRRNNSFKKQVSINEKGVHYGYFENDILIGVISTLESKNIVRIKGFLVDDAYQGKGVGRSLIKRVIRLDKDMTVYATKKSRKMFENQGFKKVNEKQNDIVFMKRNKVIGLADKEKIDKCLVDFAKIVLTINNKETRKEIIDYVYSKIQELK